MDSSYKVKEHLAAMIQSVDKVSSRLAGQFELTGEEQVKAELALFLHLGGNLAVQTILLNKPTTQEMPDEVANIVMTLRDRVTDVCGTYIENFLKQSTTRDWDKRTYQ